MQPKVSCKNHVKSAPTWRLNFKQSKVQRWVSNGGEQGRFRCRNKSTEAQNHVRFKPKSGPKPNQNMLLEAQTEAVFGHIYRVSWPKLGPNRGQHRSRVGLQQTYRKAPAVGLKRRPTCHLKSCMDRPGGDGWSLSNDTTCSPN